jgi:peptidoglycan/LPS O-acetylase OafA/YrhL
MPDIVTKFWGPMPKYEAGPIVVVLTFAVCILSWHFFEKPASRLKRFFWNASLSRPSGRMEPEPEGARSRESPKTARAY